MIWDVVKIRVSLDFVKKKKYGMRRILSVFFGLVKTADYICFHLGLKRR